MVKSASGSAAVISPPGYVSDEDYPRPTPLENPPRKGSSGGGPWKIDESNFEQISLDEKELGTENKDKDKQKDKDEDGKPKVPPVGMFAVVRFFVSLKS